MAEWSIAPVLKTVIPFNRDRGFESLPLRQDRTRVNWIKTDIVDSYYLRLGIWVVVVGALFAFLWRKGYLVRVSTYVAETREELKKCTWPTFEELKGSTVVVMITLALLGAFTVGVDFVVSQLIRFILG